MIHLFMLGWEFSQLWPQSNRKSPQASGTVGLDVDNFPVAMGLSLKKIDVKKGRWCSSLEEVIFFQQQPFFSFSFFLFGSVQRTDVSLKFM